MNNNECWNLFFDPILCIFRILMETKMYFHEKMRIMWIQFKVQIVKHLSEHFFCVENWN